MGAVRRAHKNASRLVALACETGRHWRQLNQLSQIPRPQLIHRFLHDRPEIRQTVLTPLISARWNATRRLDEIRNHFIAIGALGGILEVGPAEFLELINLSGIRPGLHATIDAPSWLLRDGILAISLWLGNRRIYTISFCLGYEGSLLVAHVGGLQGVQNNDDGLLYRELTKAAAGMRPRDLLFEIFRMLCRKWGAAHILAISDASRHHFSAYSQRWVGEDPVNSSYDHAWIERGGLLREDGFFALATTTPMRSVEEIPSKKRAMYRVRYSMLDRISAALHEALSDIPRFRQHPNHGQLTRPEATGLST